MRLEFESVLGGIARARHEPLKSHPLALLITHDLPPLVPSSLLTQDHKIEGSAGKGRWAETVWLGLFDTRVTDSAQRGVYLVYLFDGAGRHVYLSLNQATTSVRDAVGHEYRTVLAARAKTLLTLIGRRPAGTATGPIDLGAELPLSEGYESGNVIAYKYKRNEVPDDEKLIEDLRQMIESYAALVETSWRGLWSPDVVH